jgi:hypothetical protein
MQDWLPKMVSPGLFIKNNFGIARKRYKGTCVAAVIDEKILDWRPNGNKRFWPQAALFLIFYILGPYSAAPKSTLLCELKCSLL